MNSWNQIVKKDILTQETPLKPGGYFLFTRISGGSLNFGIRSLDHGTTGAMTSAHKASSVRS